jgi:hypothetical protein
VRSPAVSNTSLHTQGRPMSGPTGSPARIAAAARSASRTHASRSRRVGSAFSDASRRSISR